MSEQSKIDAERAAFEAAFEGVFFSSCFEREDDGSYAGRGLQGAWLGWQKARSLPVGVPDASELQRLLDEVRDVRSAEDVAFGWYEAVDRMRAPATPTVKAEQVQCDTCHGQGEICVGQQTFGYMSMQPPEPIMEVCPECGGEEAPSLPAAGSADLTAVRCQCCATEYPHDSYDAGFIAGSGMCQVCDAAIPAKDLPAAGSAVEEVEVVGWLGGNGLHAEESMASGAPFPLMTVAQHNRIVSALSAQQSAPERVSVSRDLLADLISSDHDTKIQAERALYALLASHAEGGKV